MCGILGFTKYIASPSQVIMASAMVDKMVDRGRQSWGSTDGTNIYKAASNVMTDNWLQSHIGSASEGHLQTMLVHTRASSHGSICIENAHPHIVVSDDMKHLIIGVHNGTITDASMKARNHKNFEVDSQMVYDILVNGQPTADLEGTGVLVYMQDYNSLRMLRFNSTNLYVARDLGTGGLVWASTEEAVLKAAHRGGVTLSTEIKLAPLTIYEVQDSPEGHTLVEIGKQEFATPKAVVTTINGAEFFHATWGGHARHQTSGYHSTDAGTLCTSCKSLRKAAQGIGLCLVCSKIALAPSASVWYTSMIYTGDYVGPALTAQPTLIVEADSKTASIINDALEAYCPHFGDLIGK